MAAVKKALITRQDHVTTLIQHVFGTDKGRELLLHLRAVYVDQSCFDEDAHVMAGRCKQAELILSLIKEVEKVNPLEKIKVLGGI